MSGKKLDGFPIVGVSATHRSTFENIGIRNQNGGMGSNLFFENGKNFSPIMVVPPCLEAS